MPATTHRHAELERCAHTCHECQDVCLETLTRCLDMGGEHAQPEHIHTLLDCIAICGVSHDLLHRGSHLHPATCGACAEICRACAESCEAVGRGEKQMRECAEECWRCAELCESMSR